MAAVGGPQNEQMQYQIYTCPVIKKGKQLQTFADCEESFSRAFQLEIVNTVTDGDCFFHALEEFGKRSRYRPLHKNRQELRNAMVQYLLGDRDIASFGYTPKQLRELEKKGAYACDAGDLPSQYSHKAFGINLHVCIFNHDAHQNVNYLTVQSVYYAKDVPDVPDVYVLRIGAHYKLLWPRNLETTQVLLAVAIEDEKPKERQRANNRTRRNAENKAAKKSSKNSNSLEKALKAIANANKTSKKSPKKTPSMERNLKAIANALANQEKESMKRNLKAIANAEKASKKSPKKTPSMEKELNAIAKLEKAFEEKAVANAIKAAANAEKAAKKSPVKNNITRKGPFFIKTKYKHILDMTVPEIEEFIRTTFKLRLPKQTKQNYLNFISDQLNSM